MSESPEEPTPAPRVSIAWVLRVAEEATARHGDAQVDDYGVPVAALARAYATALGMTVYGSVYARAAALCHSLGRLRWLERGNLAVAVAVTAGFLDLHGVHARPSKDDIRALHAHLQHSNCTAESVMRLLRAWPPV